MALTNQEIKQFVQITNDRGSSKEEPIVYGTIEVHNDTKYVRIDGSSEITPVTSTVAIRDGDRVTLAIKNHTATVTGNLTDPSASGKDMHQASITIEGMGIAMRGVVTFESLTAEGTTVIDGSRIQTGTIDADRLNLTGAITFSDLSSAVQSDIEDAYDMAEDAYNEASDAYDLASDVDDIVYGWSYNGGTYIDGSMIKAGTVMAGELIGGSVSLLTSAEKEAGSLNITGSSSSSYTVELESNGAAAIRTNDGDIDLYADPGGRIILSSVIKCYEDTRPSTGATYALGSSSYAWDDVYCNNEPTVTSDREAKMEIEYGLSRYDEVFDALKPVSFLYKQNDSGRRHLGLIAQDVEDILNDKGIPSKDFAPFIKSPKHNDDGVIEGEYDYALRYGELIALCIEQIQSLKARVAQLENQNGIQ